ncbi:hypothetical protein Y1Q_0022861 [Alligator mississippiensis]|uniref:Uncharacterized protein n=1 Tax=Alligator mississippiensis TaxID=8496 RepID=A0A151N4N9_ALLMI|nr:hypothetical protein Y1Q_0022861 [Alligator mississippiensis]
MPGPSLGFALLSRYPSLLGPLDRTASFALLSPGWKICHEPPALKKQRRDSRCNLQYFAGHLLTLWEVYTPNNR